MQQQNLANEKRNLDEQPFQGTDVQNQGNIVIDARAVQQGLTILVSWNAVPNEATCEVEIKRINQGNGVTIIVLSQLGAMSPFHDKRVAIGTNYRYQIIISSNGQVSSIQTTGVVHVNPIAIPPPIENFDWQNLDDAALANIAQTIAVIQEERLQQAQVEQNELQTHPEE